MITFRLLAEFTFIYITLTAVAQLVNKIISITPTYGLNIAVTIIATIIVLKRSQLQSLSHSGSLLLSATAGFCAIASLYALSYVVVGFQIPSLFEGLMSFLVNAAIAGATIYFINSSSQHSNET